MAIFYSPSEKGFFNTELISQENIPEDKIELSLQKYEELITGQSSIGEIKLDNGFLSNCQPSIEGERINAIRRLNSAAEKYVLNTIDDAYPDFEKETFDLQLNEAKSWQLNSSAQTPCIDLICKNRFGISFTETDRQQLITKILEKSNKYKRLALTIAGQRQAFESEIMNLKEVNKLRKMKFMFST